MSNIGFIAKRLINSLEAGTKAKEAAEARGVRGHRALRRIASAAYDAEHAKPVVLIASRTEAA